MQTEIENTTLYKHRHPQPTWIHCLTKVLPYWNEVEEQRERDKGKPHLWQLTSQGYQDQRKQLDTPLDEVERPGVLNRTKPIDDCKAYYTSHEYVDE